MPWSWVIGRRGWRSIWGKNNGQSSLYQQLAVDQKEGHQLGSYMKTGCIRPSLGLTQGEGRRHTVEWANVDVAGCPPDDLNESPTVLIQFTTPFWPPRALTLGIETTSPISFTHAHTHATRTHTQSAKKVEKGECRSANLVSKIIRDCFNLNFNINYFH